jgi:hypothetical protein
MGFPTTVVGFIKVEGDLEDALDKIQQLPSIEEDEWPFMPREIFSVVENDQGLLSYKGEHIIHFGMCIKEAQNSWDEWLSKFEQLFKSMDTTEAFVVLNYPVWDSGEFDGNFYYKWELIWPENIPVCERRSDKREWFFKGEPRSF